MSSEKWQKIKKIKCLTNEKHCKINELQGRKNGGGRKKCLTRR